MNSNVMIVTGANSSYFYFAQGLIRSIRDKREGKDIAICFLDLDCRDDELAWLAVFGVSVKKPGWDFDFPGCDDMPNYFKAMTVRPNLPDHFPEYDVVIWMDADTWIQDWSALELYVEGVERKGFAITPEVHASYAGCLTHSNQLRHFIYDKYEQAFGREVAEQFQNCAVLNTGVCGMHRESELRKAWIENLARGLTRTRHFMVDLLSMNLAFYQNFDCFFPAHVELLPPVCNWMCHQSSPIFDEETGLFLSPTLPNEVVGILHRTTDVLKRRSEIEISTRAGGTVTSTIEYANGSYSDHKPTIESWQEDSGWATDK